ncbi:MexH family multidrug efflux RND transporter periplasmic adaptor subunit [Prolixibacter bellariivorans]|uniref:MexH family multidrug efflux RND transporter periplasmic adaptor subunit n=2 Tax=Prolixibacter bellariivorans TaxID=314319 RepID=A0A5M4AZS9_9BACT|nr:MexH family multidrug efflux RND transporter periplasmic adaptor subunit [Prolixibacter bellariivorans]
MNTYQLKELKLIQPGNMKKLLFILPLAFLFACSATTTDEGDRKAKEQLLQDYRQQATELKQKIAQLEKELGTTKADKTIPVKVDTIAQKLFTHTIEVTGNVEANEDITVAPETPGNIISIVVTEGQHVKKGTVMGRLNTEAIQRNIEDLQIQLELAKTVFERQQKLWDQHIGSEIEYLQAKSNKESLERKLEGLQAQLDMATIKSPIDGVVDRIYQKQGEIAGPAIPFAKVVNISNVRIYADVSESYLTSIHAGQEVEINFPALNKTVTAPIFRKSSTINPDNRTFQVRINLNNPDKEIRPNLVSLLHITDYKAADAIVVPSILIKNDFNGKYVFVAAENSGKWKASKRYVETGRNNNNYTMLSKGLKPGEKLIVEGYEQVVDGSPISIN